MIFSKFFTLYFLQQLARKYSKNVVTADHEIRNQKLNLLNNL